LAWAELICTIGYASTSEANRLQFPRFFYATLLPFGNWWQQLKTLFYEKTFISFSDVFTWHPDLDAATSAEFNKFQGQKSECGKKCKP